METETLDGDDGTVILDAEKIIVGKVPGRLYDHQRHLTVTVDVRVERLERREKYPTIHHGEMTKPLALRFTTAIWQPDGKDCVSVGMSTRGVIEVARDGKPEKGFTRAGLLEMAAFAERWRLNDMRAACAHQKVEKHGPRKVADACPETGYRHGEAWP
jgi:hypothetical protein